MALKSGFSFFGEGHNNNNNKKSTHRETNQQTNPNNLKVLARSGKYTYEPSTWKVEAEDQKLKVILSYIAN